MRRLLFPALVLCVIVLSTHGQRKFREVDLRISGVRSGSSYRAVIAKLGKPKKRQFEKESAENSCLAADATLLTLYYSGLRVVLLGDGSGRNMTVQEMLVSRGKWSASGITLGATEAQVTRRFGKPVSIGRKGSKSEFMYVTPGNLGNVRFEFTNGRLTLIGMSETLC